MDFNNLTIENLFVSWTLVRMYHRWAGKTLYMHLAPEYEYRAKHLMKTHKN